MSDITREIEKCETHLIVDTLLDDMLKIDSLRIWRVGNNICVAFQNYADIKEGGFLKGIFGEGYTLPEAVRDYARQISGKTLVAYPTSENRKEITILVIGDK